MSCHCVGVEDWSVSELSEEAGAASITLAAPGAGFRHVCTALHASVSRAQANAPTGVQRVVIRDGSTGSGTIIFAGLLVPAQGVTSTGTGGWGQDTAQFGELKVFGNENTAMTVEFMSNAPSNEYQAVNASGYTEKV